MLTVSSIVLVTFYALSQVILIMIIQEVSDSLLIDVKTDSIDVK